MTKPDRAFRLLTLLPSLALILSMGAVFYFLASNSALSLNSFGLGFLASSEWDPVLHQYGALPFIFGTLFSSLLAVTLSAPLCIGVALFLTEVLPQKPKLKKMASWIRFLIEMLAAIPSVVYGLWGIFVLCPWLLESVEPWLSKNFGTIPLFQGAPLGVGMLAAVLILAIMIAPTITSLSCEIISSVSNIQKEAAYGLGATRWEMIRTAILGPAKSGFVSAIMIALGRALGETMAVTMVIGNQNTISLSLFSPAATLSSQIANEYAEAMSPIHLSSLTELALVLLCVSFLVNLVAGLIFNCLKPKGAK